MQNGIGHNYDNYRWFCDLCEAILQCKGQSQSLATSAFSLQIYIRIEFSLAKGSGGRYAGVIPLAI